jgi:monofunctional glycosyltransferase
MVPARRFARRLSIWLLKVLAGAMVFSILWILAYRVVPPPGSLLMLLRLAEGHGIEKDWTPIEDISPNLVRAVIASEDARFCSHSGFDWTELRAALSSNQEGGRLRGASTITMQTAKNAFLWPDRTLIRKGVEAWFTLLIEALWPKERTMEVYLNLAEWGGGIYGAEAAARHWFDRPAERLSARQAALLAAALPSPLTSRPGRPSSYLSRRAATIESRMRIVERDGLAACVLEG